MIVWCVDCLDEHWSGENVRSVAYQILTRADVKPVCAQECAFDTDEPLRPDTRRRLDCVRDYGVVWAVCPYVLLSGAGFCHLSRCFLFARGRILSFHLAADGPWPILIIFAAFF